MIGVMVFMKRKALSFTQLSHAVETMRADVRSEEKDVHSNGRVSKLLFKFILEKLPMLVLRSDGQGDKSAQSTLPPLSRTPRPPKSTSKKRKRTVEGNYDGDSSSDPAGSRDDDHTLAQGPSGPPPAKVPRLLAKAGCLPTIHESISLPASSPSRTVVSLACESH